MDISELLKLWRVEKGASQLAKMPTDFYSVAKKLTEGDNPYEAKKATELFNDIVHMRQHKMLMACLRQLRSGDKPENLLGNEKEAYNRIFIELQGMRSNTTRVVEETTVEGETDEAQETLAEAEEIAEAEEEVTAPDDISVPKEELEENKEVEVPQEEAVCEEVEGEVACTVSEKEEPKEEPEKPPEEVKEEEQEPEKKEEENKEVFKGETENKPLKRVKFTRTMPAFVGPDLESLGPFEEDQEVELEDEIAEILLKNGAVELL